MAKKRQRNRNKVGGCAINSTPAVLSDGTIAAGCNKGRLVWIKGTKIMKSVYISNDYSNSSPAVLKDQTIVIGTDDAIIWSKNGKQKKFLTRESKSRHSPNSSPSIMGDDVVVGDDSGHMYWLRLGKLIHKQELAYKTSDSPNIYGTKFHASFLPLIDGSIVASAWESQVVWANKKEFKYKLDTKNTDKTPALLADGSVVVAERNKLIVYR